MVRLGPFANFGAKLKATWLGLILNHDVSHLPRFARHITHATRHYLVVASHRVSASAGLPSRIGAHNLLASAPIIYIECRSADERMELGLIRWQDTACGHPYLRSLCGCVAPLPMHSTRGSEFPIVQAWTKQFRLGEVSAPSIVSLRRPGRV